MSVRISPSAEEIEKQVIGAVIVEGIGAYEKVGGFIRPSAFYYEPHRNIWRAIIQLAEKKSQIDVITIVDQLKRDNLLEASIGEYYIAELALSVTSASNINSHALILFEKELLRFQINSSIKFADLAAVNGADPFQIASEALGAYQSVLNAKSRLVRENADHFSVAVDIINSPMEYIPTVFPRLRELIGGFSRKALSSIGGKSGHNKTTFSLADATESIKLGYVNKLLFISVDEPGEMIARRIIAKEMNISLKAMRDKKVEGLTKELVEKFVKSIYNGKLIILDNVRTPEAIQQAIIDIAPDRTILDRVQDVTFADNDGISEQGITYTLKLLKTAAMQTNSNVTVLSQVKDKVIDERFEDKIPRPHDFYYASTMRQKSREQCVVYWGYKDTQDELQLPFFEFIIWKSTYSETGKVRFFIDPDHASFRESSVSKVQIDKPKSEQDIWSKI